MYDYIRINKTYTPPKQASFGSPFEYKGIMWSPVFRNGESYAFTGKLENLDLKINTYRRQLTITNSFHSFLKGSNQGDFTVTEMEQVIDMLSDQLGCDLKTGRVSKLEYGCNLHTADSRAFYMPLISFRGNDYQNMVYKGGIYGKSGSFKQYAIKAYSKSEQLKTAKGIILDEEISRWEVKVNDLSYLRSKGIGVIEVNDILNRDIARLMASDLKLKYINTIKSVQNLDLSHITTAERKAYWLYSYDRAREDIRSHCFKTFQRIRAIHNRILKNLPDNNVGDFSKQIQSKCQELIEN